MSGDRADRESGALPADTLRREVLAYLDEHEHPDDWGVTCVYTSGLRDLLAVAVPVPDEADREARWHGAQVMLATDRHRLTSAQPTGAPPPASQFTAAPAPAVPGEDEEARRVIQAVAAEQVAPPHILTENAQRVWLAGRDAGIAAVSAALARASRDTLRHELTEIHQPQAVVDGRMRPVVPEEFACRECGRAWPCKTTLLAAPAAPGSDTEDREDA